MKMRLVHRVWWRMLMDLRPLFRVLAERFPKAAPWAVFSRMAGHVLAGNPILLVIAVLALAAIRIGASITLVGALGLAVFLAAEGWHRWLFESGRGGLIVGWREAWRMHRRMPFEWARAAAKTTTVQAEVGTSKEPVASAKLRPIADHPKMGWWPTVHWPQVSWWVGPPPGRSFDKFDEVLGVLSANYARCVGMELDYDKPTDSYARLTVSFGSVLDKIIEPAPVEVDAKPWTPTIVTTLDPAEPVDIPTPAEPDDDEGWSPVVVDGAA